MWFFVTKRELKEESEKTRISFEKRDSALKLLAEELKNHSLKIATLEGAILNRNNIPINISGPETKTDNMETRIAKRIMKHNKNSIAISKIMELIDTCSTKELENKIVHEMNICSSASFYRYLRSLKKQKLLNTVEEDL